MGQIVDSDARAIGALLPEFGIDHTHRQTVGDNLARIVEALRLALGRSDLVFTIGGLGPTQDDLTREAIALALGDELVSDPDIESGLREFFASRKLPWVDSQLRQTRRPASARIIENPNGTAPGLLAQKDGKVVIAMPGPPGEFLPMLRGPVRDFLAQVAGDQVMVSHVLRVAGMGEAAIESALGALTQGHNPSVAPYAKTGEVHLRVTAKASSRSDAEALIQPVISQIRSLLGRHVYGLDEVTLESASLDFLRASGQTLAVAESCTGGVLAARLSAIPGASSVFKGGVVTYTNEAKIAMLGVSPETLERESAYSESCAREMALGIQARFGVDWSLSVTGIAGPDGGTPEKPVGLVYIGLASPTGRASVSEHRFRGQREDIRARAAQMALLSLYFAL